MPPLSKIMASRLFIICALAMLVIAVVMSPLESATRRWVSKRPVQLRKPVQDLDVQNLTGLAYRSDVEGVELLGDETEDYIVWYLDPGGGHEPVGLVVSYYTYTDPGRPLNIPHTTEVCAKQEGYEIFQLGSSEIHVPGSASQAEAVKVKFVRYGHPTVAANKDMCAVYSLCVNGQFTDDREMARINLAMPWHRAAYFVKIECHAAVKGGNFDETRRLCERIVGQVIGELLKNHLPTEQDIVDAATASTE